ncbi:hypothetical protein Tco_0319506 [Tanacetum coccineum]
MYSLARFTQNHYQPLHVSKDTKVIINHFMSKDQSIPRRNKVDWHLAKDDPVLTIMRFIPKHETIQKYGAILPNTLTNQAIKESDAYKTYYDFATRKVIPKPKYVRRSTREKTDQAPKDSPKIALSEADQMILITKRSKTQFHSSHVSGSGANKGTGVSPGVPDMMIMKTESHNDGDDFVHPKFSTHYEEERQDGEDKDKEWSDDKAYDEVTQDGNVDKEKMDEEKTNEEEEIN